MGDDVDPPDEIVLPAETLPSVDELLSEPSIVAADETPTSAQDEQFFDDHFSARAIVAEREWAHLKGLWDHYKLKKNWSWFLMGLLGGMIGFQWVLLAMVGGGAGESRLGFDLI